METEAVGAWALHAPLWSSETNAAHAGRWLAKAEGKALLELKPAQINTLRDAVSQARDNAALKAAIATLGGSAAEHEKSVWNRKGETPGLRSRLWAASEAALDATAGDGSEQNSAFKALLKRLTDPAEHGKIEEARNLKIRKQFLFFVIERQRTWKWLPKGERA
jgi:hypothetical protein